MIIFEHKGLNKELRAALIVGEIPEDHRAQMEQQLMISGAEKCLFMASKWGDNDELIEELHCWYESDQSMRDRILQGWVQFAIDLEEYKRKLSAGEIAPPSVEVIAAPIRDLPSITYKMHGMALSTNLHQDVKPAILILVEQSKRPLETDQDFADLDALCKKFALAEDQCELIAAQVDAEFKDPDKFKKDLKELQEFMAQARIAGKKRVTSEKDTRKAKIISDARETYIAHVAALEVETKPIKLNLLPPDFIGAIKGMAKLDNIKGKCDDIIASSKITADTAAKDVRAKLTWCKENADGFGFLFKHDLQSIIGIESEAFKATIKNRIREHQDAEAAKLEAQRVEMQAEADAKAKEKAEAEAAAKLKADEERIRAEERAKSEAEDLLIESIWKNARRIESNTVPYIEKAISTFETGAKDFENDPRQRVAHAVAEARKEMQVKLFTAKAEAEQRTQAGAQAKATAEEKSKAAPDSDFGLSGIASDGKEGLVRVISKRPTKMQMVEAVAKEFGVSVCTADEWLMGAFSQEREAA